MKRLACLAGAAILTSAAQASVHFTSQSNVLNFGFTQPGFADARIDGSNTIASRADAAGDAAGIGWGYYQNPLLNQHVTVTGGVTVDGVSIGNGMQYTVHHLTGAPGTHTYYYTRTSPDSALFAASPVGNLWQLHYQSNATPLVEGAGPFDLTLTFPGDWSSHGTGAGQSEFVSINPGWSVMQDFVFDGTLTTLTLSRQTGIATGPGLVMNLYAAPAPGPVALIGLAGLGMLRRQRR